MTAIAGIIENKTVYIGGDSAGVSGLSLEVRLDPKVFINGPFIIGFTSSFRMGQLLMYSFAPPKHPKGYSDERFMSTTFVDSVRQCFKDGGYTKISENREKGGTFLIGYQGKLFYMDSDFQIGIPAREYTAIGCGQDICLGSLYSTSEENGCYDMKPEDRIITALQAAEAFNGGVRNPFNVLCKKASKK